MGQTQNKAGNFDLNALNTESVVLWFDDLGTGNEDYNFLSNFYQGKPFTLPGVTWDGLLRAEGVSQEEFDLLSDWRGPVGFVTGEHAFAAMKFWGSDHNHFYDIVTAPGPNPAKALGRSRKHPIREDWEVVKLDVMAAVTRAKYAVGREESALLLNTGDRLLVEGTMWGDEVWGVALDEAGMPGRNWLGTLLMARRAELRAYESFNATSAHVKHFVSDTVKHNMVFSA